MRPVHLHIVIAEETVSDKNTSNALSSASNIKLLKMLLLKILLLVIQIYNYGRVGAEVGRSETCADCMDYRLCDGAAVAASTRTEQAANLFRRGFCGFTETTNGTAKVCCSLFSAYKQNTPKILQRWNGGKLDLLPEKCGPINGKRIHGGSRACMYEFPWMALISYRTAQGPEFKCAGSIINSRYVLTAAHCVDGMTILGVRVGEYNKKTAMDCQEDSNGVVCESHLQNVAVTKKIVHEDYSRTKYGVKNDIALLRVRRKFNFNFRNVDTICLPISEELRNSNLTSSTGTVAGWGITETNKESDILLKVELPILPDDQCQAQYNRLIPGAKGNEESNNLVHNEFCAGAPGKDSCRGDSGGPFSIEADYNGTVSFIQYGIVSRGPTQCGSTSPGIYTDVRKHMDWILDKLEP